MAFNQVALYIIIGCLIVMAYYMDKSQDPAEMMEKIGDSARRLKRWINKQ